MREEKLRSLGLSIPEAAKALAAYVPAKLAGPFIYTSGQLPMKDGKLLYAGHAGTDFSREEAYQACKISALNCLGAIKTKVKSLDEIEAIVKINVFISSSPDFFEQPFAANGASDLMLEIFGEEGIHGRTAVGVASLPMNALCEVEMIVKLKQGQRRC